MKDNKVSPETAIPTPDDTLTILREVSHVYEHMKDLRRRTARLAKDNGSTYQDLSDAMGINRSSAYALIKDAA